SRYPSEVRTLALPAPEPRAVRTSRLATLGRTVSATRTTAAEYASSSPVSSGSTSGAAASSTMTGQQRRSAGYALTPLTPPCRAVRVRQAVAHTHWRPDSGTDAGVAARSAAGSGERSRLAAAVSAGPRARAGPAIWGARLVTNPTTSAVMITGTPRSRSPAAP